MAYNALDTAHPVVTGTRTAEIDKTRQNIAALRDSIASFGGMQGFNYNYGIAGGGTAEQPTEMVFEKDPDRIYVALTWGTSGGSAGNVIKAAFYYSSNSGVAYSPMVDDSGNYVMSLTYDADSILVATTWGAVP